MAQSTLDFYQIIFKEEQRPYCYPFAKIYFNEHLTANFENDVIARLVPQSTADYISVCSWRLAQKRGESSTPMVLKGRTELSEEKITQAIENERFDVAILTPRRPTHPALYMASAWHGKAWDDAFKVFNEGFLQPQGIKIPDYQNGKDLKHAIYENHFIARKEIYQEYVGSVLNKAISFVARDAAFDANSGYITKKRDAKEIKEYQEKSGRQDWPIAPFILERLFSIWINDKNFKVINI